jgi:hypothetical protein
MARSPPTPGKVPEDALAPVSPMLQKCKAHADLPETLVVVMGMGTRQEKVNPTPRPPAKQVSGSKGQG